MNTITRQLWALYNQAMTRTEKAAFAGLVLAQAAHSIEEASGRMWEIHAPARFVSGLVSPDLATRFALLNAGVVAAGLLTLFIFVLPSRAGAAALVWFWVIVEILNGAGHLGWAALRGGYAPGVITAPALLFFAVSLFVLRLRRQGGETV